MTGNPFLRAMQMQQAAQDIEQAMKDNAMGASTLNPALEMARSSFAALKSFNDHMGRSVALQRDTNEHLAEIAEGLGLLNDHMERLADAAEEAAQRSPVHVNGSARFSFTEWLLFGAAIAAAVHWLKL